MPRGRRTSTVTAEEPVPAVDEVDAASTGREFEESDDELDAVMLDPNDLYEDTAPPSEEDIEPISEVDKADEEVAESAIEDSDLIYVTYRGLRSTGRAPGTITVNVPDDGTEPDDKTAIITTGETFTLRPGVPVRATEEQADWLSRHPHYQIEKS